MLIFFLVTLKITRVQSFINLDRVGVEMKKIIIKDKEIIKKILQNKSNCNEMTIYIMGENEKLAIVDTDTLKRRIFVPIEKIKNVIKNI